MPNKKNKNQGRNAFYFFMVSLRPQLERQGVILENGMQTLAEIAGPRWKELPEHEKEVYQEMARQSKINKRFAAPRNDRLDCTGELISKRVDTVGINEKRRRAEREEVKKTWPMGKAVCNEKFIMVAFMSLCELLPDDRHLPCEVGAAEFSLRDGILRTMHRFIRPGAIPLGFRYQAMKFSEETHKIPADERGLAGENDSYRSVWMELLNFVNPDKKTAFPPVYCRISETKQTEICLNWLARNAEMTNKLRKVYELEGLICDLHVHSGSVPFGISKSQATDLISSTVFDYEPNTRCTWHEEQEVKFCALGTAKRYCYCMADFLCPVYSIILTPTHVPERPEGSFCTVVNPSELERNKDDDSEDDEDKSQSMYARRGPTYDARSLQDPAPPIYPTSSQQPSAASAAEKPQGAFVTSFGRGRGRGRGAVPSQPLRRPGVMQQQQQQQQQPAKSSWASMASSEPPSPVPPGNIPMWASSDPGESGASTRTKMYAGSASAPPASFAPSPPLAWQQQHTTYFDERPPLAGEPLASANKQINSAASGWTGANNLATQMNSMGLMDGTYYRSR